MAVHSGLLPVHTELLYLLLLCMFSMFSKISMCKWSNVSFNLSFNIAVNMCNDK